MTIWSGVRPAVAIDTAAAPVASAIRRRSACTAGADALSGSASTRHAIVEAVPMTAQVPAVVARFRSTRPISSSGTSPGR